MPSIVKSLRLLADPTRLRLLALVMREELSVAELQEVLGMGQSRISSQLALLRQAGLVSDRREGKKAFYSLRTSLPPRHLALLKAAVAKATEGVKIEPQRFEKDDDVRAVVLRIDSPGGSALASDLIWHRLMKLREKKPLVVSVGDMAASGGYYMACTGTVIFAEPTSIVGSIGVVGGKVAAEHTLEMIGVHAETFAANTKNPNAAARAAYLSPLIAWDDDTRTRVFQTMTSFYDLFLARIAEGRKTTADKIAPNAEGRIFSGTEGKARGLVDELGGLGAAIARARVLANLPADARVEAIAPSRNVLESLGAGGSRDSDGEESASATAPLGREVPRLVELVVQAAPDVGPFLQSLLPLASGEHALTAVPFALVVR